jgi:hypothetical protein
MSRTRTTQAAPLRSLINQGHRRSLPWREELQTWLARVSQRIQNEPARAASPLIELLSVIVCLGNLRGTCVLGLWHLPLDDCQHRRLARARRPARCRAQSNQDAFIARPAQRRPGSVRRQRTCRRLRYVRGGHTTAHRPAPTNDRLGVEQHQRPERRTTAGCLSQLNSMGRRGRRLRATPGTLLGAGRRVSALHVSGGNSGPGPRPSAYGHQHLRATRLRRERTYSSRSASVVLAHHDGCVRSWLSLAPHIGTRLRNRRSSRLEHPHRGQPPGPRDPYNPWQRTTVRW